MIYDQKDFTEKYENESSNQSVAKERRVDYTNCNFG